MRDKAEVQTSTPQEQSQTCTRKIALKDFLRALKLSCAYGYLFLHLILSSFIK